MEPTTEVTAHIPYLVAHLTPSGVARAKADFITDVRRHGHEPVTEPEVRKARFFPGAIDMSADEDGFRYYLSVMVKA